MSPEKRPIQPQQPPFNLREIIDGSLVEPHFQPIVSLNRRSIIGVEGLSRGLHPGTQQLIPPADLFHQAMIQGLQSDLDRLCRKKIMEDFRLVLEKSPELFLTLNLDVSVFDQGATASGRLHQQVSEIGLQPEQIALEIIESKVEDVRALQKFVEEYRGYGFLIALDDVGAGHSNLNRVPLIKPDILKIDRYLVQDIQGDFYKQEVLRSLVNMSRRLGALVIAEGVETQEEALYLLDMGVDMIQGYFFSRPQRRNMLEKQAVTGRIEGLGEVFKRTFLKRLGAKKFQMSRFYATIMEAQMELRPRSPDRFDDALEELVGRFAFVEGAYILDEGGRQATEYLSNRQGRTKRRSMVFQPFPKGSDHTMKDYYYSLVEEGASKSSYVTEPYLSMASGNSCATISSIFTNEDKNRYILCLDVNTEDLDMVSKD